MKRWRAALTVKRWVLYASWHDQRDFLIIINKAKFWETDIFLQLASEATLQERSWRVQSLHFSLFFRTIHICWADALNSAESRQRSQKCMTKRSWRWIRRNNFMRYQYLNILNMLTLRLSRSEQSLKKDELFY